MNQKKESQSYELGREFAKLSFLLPEAATAEAIRVYVRDKLAVFTKEFVSGPAQSVDEFTEELEGEDVPKGWFDALLDRVVPLSFTRIRSLIKVRRIERVVKHTTKVMNICGHLALEQITNHELFLVSSPTYHLRYRPVTEYLRQGAHDEPLIREVMEAAWEFGGGRAGWLELASKIADFIDGRAERMVTMEEVRAQLEALEQAVEELGNLILGIELRRDFILMVQTVAFALAETIDATEADDIGPIELVAMALEVDVGEIPVPDEEAEKFASFVHAFVAIGTGEITAEQCNFPYLEQFFTAQPEEDDAEAEAEEDAKP